MKSDCEQDILFVRKFILKGGGILNKGIKFDLQDNKFDLLEQKLKELVSIARSFKDIVISDYDDKMHNGLKSGLKSEDDYINYYMFMNERVKLLTDFKKQIIIESYFTSDAIVPLFAMRLLEAVFTLNLLCETKIINIKRLELKGKGIEYSLLNYINDSKFETKCYKQFRKAEREYLTNLEQFALWLNS